MFLIVHVQLVLLVTMLPNFGRGARLFVADALTGLKPCKDGRRRASHYRITASFVP